MSDPYNPYIPTDAERIAELDADRRLLSDELNKLKYENKVLKARAHAAEHKIDEYVEMEKCYEQLRRKYHEIAPDEGDCPRCGSWWYLCDFANGVKVWMCPNCENEVRADGVQVSVGFSDLIAYEEEQADVPQLSWWAL